MEKVFSLIKEHINNLERYGDFDINKCYINYSDVEKEKSNNICFRLSERSIPNEFFICYEWKEDIYFIVNDKEDYSNDDFTKEESNIVDLFLICDMGENQISQTIDSNEIYDRLYIYDELGYSGHTYDDIVDFFEPFSLYKLNKNSGLIDKGLLSIYVCYLISKTNNSNFPWEQSTLDIIESIIFSKSDKIPYYNIILSLTSRQWRHIFLESYKMIEHLFSVKYLKSVSDNTGIPSVELAKTFEETLNWRPPEEMAIKQIFEEIECYFANNSIYKELLCLKTKKAGEEALYKWYYKEIRNQIAHFRVLHENIEFSNDEWNIIIRFNFFVTEYMYNTYDDYIS